MKIEVEKPTLNFAKFGGHTEVLNELQDILNYFKNPEEFERLGIGVPKGILLSGPPGVGKTYLARALAGTAKTNYIYVAGGEFADGLVGGSEKLLREVFDKARKNAPCILFLDEIDAIATKRLDNPKSGSEYGINSIINQLLTLLGQDNGSVVVLAATNKPKSLDPAVVRPGRFDRHIVIELPSEKDRKDILAVHTAGKRLDVNVNLSDLAKISGDFSSAKLEAWVKKAATLAMNTPEGIITMACFAQARTQVIYGVKKMDLTDEELTPVALHQIGKAIVGEQLGRRLYQMSIGHYSASESDSIGYTEFYPSPRRFVKSHAELLNEICLALSGRAIEQLYDCVYMSSANDFTKARELAIKMLSEEGLGSSLTGDRASVAMDAEKLLREQMERAKQIIMQMKMHIEPLKQQLKEKIDLDESGFRSIIHKEKIVQKNNELREAVRHSDLPSVKTIIRQEEQTLNASAPVGNRTALHLAIFTGNKEIITSLLSEKVNVNAVDQDGNTALHLVLTPGRGFNIAVRLSIAKLLLKAPEIHPLLLNHEQQSPLMLLEAMRNNPDIKNSPTLQKSFTGLINTIKNYAFDQGFRHGKATTFTPDGQVKYIDTPILIKHTTSNELRARLGI